MIGYDKSEYQYPGSPRGDFLIIRAANGRREDYRVNGHVTDARANGVPVSLYTYCEPGLGNPETQADRMCNVADRHGIKATLWADIEEGVGDLRWFENRFVGRCNQRGYTCGTYSGSYFWGAHALQGTQGKWKAAYGSNDGAAHTPPAGAWDIWQYTSRPIDTNTADPSVVARLFGGTSAPPASEPTPSPRRTPDMYLLQTDTGHRYQVAPAASSLPVRKLQNGEVYLKLAASGVPHAEGVHELVVVQVAVDLGMTVDEIRSTLAY